VEGLDHPADSLDPDGTKTDSSAENKYCLTDRKADSPVNRTAFTLLKRSCSLAHTNDSDDIAYGHRKTFSHYVGGRVGITTVYINQSFDDIYNVLVSLQTRNV